MVVAMAATVIMVMADTGTKPTIRRTTAAMGTARVVRTTAATATRGTIMVATMVTMITTIADTVAYTSRSGSDAKKFQLASRPLTDVLSSVGGRFFAPHSD